MRILPVEICFEHLNEKRYSSVSVLVSLFNYRNHIIEALESVLRQTLVGIELVILDDCSTDGGDRLVENWIKSHNQRFTRTLLLRHKTNAGLAASRNTAILHSSSKYVFVMDADNIIFPRCVERHLRELELHEDLAFVYAIIAKFGVSTGLIGTNKWSRERLARGNYIDAMSMIRKSVLVEAGGYKKMCVPGWEDYELWCTFAERDLRGGQIPEILSHYRVHEDSMLQTQTNKKLNNEALIAEMRNLHPWLTIGS